MSQRHFNIVPLVFLSKMYKQMKRLTKKQIKQFVKIYSVNLLINHPPDFSDCHNISIAENEDIQDEIDKTKLNVQSFSTVKEIINFITK